MNCYKLIFALSGIVLFLSCSDELKPIERETLEEYQSRLAQSSSSFYSSEAEISSSSSSEGANLSSSGEAENSSSSSEEQRIAISGVFQKGPFLPNISAKLYPTSSDLTSQKGQAFWALTDDKGGFKIEGIELDSNYPYARLEADGYYRNEVSGGLSGPITLYAIADIRGKNNVNVNILTHLEYYRVKALVGLGMSLTAAKKLALEEILKIFFGINDVSGFNSGEEMSIFGTSDSDAALLAISILLQSNLSEGSFSLLLANFSQALKEKGIWDDNLNKIRMANWAKSTDLDSIEKNILDWGLSESVPNFKKYIDMYIEANSGSDDNCTNTGDLFCYEGNLIPKCGDINCNGKIEYNPETQFCYTKSTGVSCTAPMCGGKEYTPPEEQCSPTGGIVGKSCNSQWYNPSEWYCHDGDLFACNGTPYNPVTHFCYESVTIYEKCGGIKYDPTTQYCHSDNEIYSCGNKPYNPSTHFCLGSTITPFCGSKTFTSSQFCSGNTVHDKCGTAEFEPSTHFCLGSMITPLCGGQTFTSSQFCSSNVRYDKCGGTVTFTPGTEQCCGSNKYTLATHSCYNSQTYSCGNQPYNPSTHFCLGSTITTLCGGQTYISSQFCSGNAIHNKCGGTVTFAPATEQCCGSSKYKIATEFCYNSSKVGLKCGNRTEIYNPDLYECKPNINPNGIYLKVKPRDNDNNEYEAVLIGTQTWMASNLTLATQRDSRCYEDKYNNCVTYGRLYKWAKAMDLDPPVPLGCNSYTCASYVQAKHKGLCPTGWHLPTRAEWDVMTAYIGGENTEGKKLKAKSGWNNNGNGTDDYGFSAQPGGQYDSGGPFGGGSGGVWWSADEDSSVRAYLRYMRDDIDWAGWNNDYKSNMYSIRCLKD
jgi:uncharacterized protein (TIGR02145 family)